MSARSPVAVARGRPARVALWLFLSSLLIYNANLREISSADTVPARLLAVTLARDLRLDLDSFFRDYPAGRPLPAWMQRIGGHYVSTSPVFPSLLAAPIYFLPVRLLWVDPPLINLLAKVSGSLFAAASVAFVYLTLRELAPAGAALVAALVYAFGTSTWSVSSQGLWGHGPAQFWMAAAIYGVLRGERHRWAYDWAGLAAGCMFASRPQTTGFIGAALAACALRRGRWRGARCLLWFSTAALGVLAYNQWAFGSIQGGYARLNATYMPLYGLEGVWSTSIGRGLLGLLVSPSRGLFVYSPVLLFAVVGIVRLRSTPGRDLTGCLAAGLGAGVLVLSAYSLWWGGHSFGPRLLTDFLPVWAVFMAVAWSWIEPSRVRMGLFMCLAAVSVGVQAVGAFYYPSPREVDWDKTPRDVDVAHERLWDWRDPQLVRLLRNGPRPLGFGGWPSLVPETADGAEGPRGSAPDPRESRDDVGLSGRPRVRGPGRSELGPGRSGLFAKITIKTLGTGSYRTPSRRWARPGSSPVRAARGAISDGGGHPRVGSARSGSVG